MAEKRYYWLKLPEGFFRDKAIKRLRKIAGGDTYTVIYLKMLLVSMRNDGYLYFDGFEDDIASEIALELDEEPENVKVTLNFLLNSGLAEEGTREVFLTHLPDMVGSETSTAERMRKSRAKNKISGESVTMLQENVTTLQECYNDVQKSYNDVQNGYTEIEIEKDIEKEKRDRVDYNGVKNAYNRLCPGLQKCTSLSEARKKAIRARLGTYPFEDFETVFEKAGKSDFLNGKNNRNWKANFDWLIKDSNFAKVLDGNYDNGPPMFLGGYNTNPADSLDNIF